MKKAIVALKNVGFFIVLPLQGLVYSICNLLFAALPSLSESDFNFERLYYTGAARWHSG